MNYAVCTVSTPEWTPEEAVAALRERLRDNLAYAHGAERAAALPQAG
jgi:hypothetical protein